ncbi:MAG: hypothetical protein QW087_07425, partial [Methanomassiliicoccales archaeon]
MKFHSGGRPHFEFLSYDEDVPALYYAHEVGSAWDIEKVKGYINYTNPRFIAIDSSGSPYIAYSQTIEPYFEVGIVIRNSRTDDPFLNRNFKE